MIRIVRRSVSSGSPTFAGASTMKGPGAQSLKRPTYQTLVDARS